MREKKMKEGTWTAEKLLHLKPRKQQGVVGV
jgi:hypothetical protein